MGHCGEEVEADKKGDNADNQDRAAVLVERAAARAVHDKGRAEQNHAANEQNQRQRFFASVSGIHSEFLLSAFIFCIAFFHAVFFPCYVLAALSDPPSVRSSARKSAVSSDI